MKTQKIITPDSREKNQVASRGLRLLLKKKRGRWALVTQAPNKPDKKKAKNVRISGTPSQEKDE